MRGHAVISHAPSIILSSLQGHIMAVDSLHVSEAARAVAIVHSIRAGMPPKLLVLPMQIERGISHLDDHGQVCSSAL